MALVSDRLRSARERAGLDIADIAARTKIKPAFLQAIERGEFERLPGEFFARAFLKTYAEALALDSGAILEQYDSSRGAAARPAAAFPHREHSIRRTSSASRAPSPAGGSGWTVVLLAAALLIAINVIDRGPQRDGADEPVPVGTSGVAEAAALPEPEAPPAEATVAPRDDAAPDALRLEIRPAEELWIAAHADGERVLYRLLQPGEVVALEAAQGLALRIGNAGAFEYTINGVPGRALGGPGEVRDVLITRENYTTYRR